MKPAAFRYERPTTIDAAVDLLASDPEARVLAGGQSLMALMAMRLARPELLVDINEIPELARIDDAGPVIEIGAGVRQRAVERHPAVRAALPVLSGAIALIGHPTIRNRGTVCGSLAHADPASELPAVAVALDAEMVIRSASATREVPAREFFVGPFTTSMEQGEMLTHVRFDVRKAPRYGAIVEHARRSGDFAVAGAVCGLDVDADGQVTDARVVGFGVDSFPRRSSAAEAPLRSATLAGAASLDPAWSAMLDDSAQQLADHCEPTSDIHGSAAYRRRIVGEMLRRAVRRCADGWLQQRVRPDGERPIDTWRDRS